MAAVPNIPNHDEYFSGVGTQLPLANLREQGAYVCNWDGHLVRMPETIPSTFGSPFFNIVSKEPLFVTKISENPYVSISTARQVASNLDVPVNF